MKPQHLKIPNNADQSFSVRKDMVPNINNRWHCHTEIELICFHKGTGTQFVGDNVQRFSAGDIVLVGSDLPHYWRYDETCFNDDHTATQDPFSTVIHFNYNFLGERFLMLPEFKGIKTILEKAKRGILIKGKEAQSIAKLIGIIYQRNGPHKVIALLECLIAIVDLRQFALLSSIGFKYDYKESESDRMNNIYNFALKNFKNKIQLEQISAVADLVPNSFCRYFKARTGKTFSGFITDIRVGYACKLIIENKLDVKQICYESGFNNFSCFHKSFKKVTGKTPKIYQESHSLL